MTPWAHRMGHEPTAPADRRPPGPPVERSRGHRPPGTERILGVHPRSPGRRPHPARGAAPPRVGAGATGPGGGGEGAEARDKKGQGMGAGAGMGSEPIGFLVSRGEEIEFLEAGKAHGLSAAVEKLPSMIERIYENRNREEVEPA